MTPTSDTHCCLNVWTVTCHVSTLRAPNISTEYTLCLEKKRPRYFQLQLSHFSVDFYNFCTIGTGINSPQLHIIYLLKGLMTS